MRSHSYNVLGELQRKGIVRRFEENGKTKFSAAHPDRLLDLLRQKEKELDSARNLLQSALPEMIADFALAGNLSGVFRFAGKDGLKRVYEDMLKDRLEIATIQNRELLRKFLGPYNEEFVAKRVRYGIYARVLTAATKASLGISIEDKQDIRSVRYLAESSFPWKMALKITKSKVVLTTFLKKGAVGIVINEEEIARNFLLLFELLWERAESKKTEDS